MSCWRLNQRSFYAKCCISSNEACFSTLKSSTWKADPKTQAFRTESQYHHINHSHSRNYTINGPKSYFNRGLQGKAKFLIKPPSTLPTALHLSSTGTRNTSPFKPWGQPQQHGVAKQSPLGWGRNLDTDAATMNLFIPHKCSPIRGCIKLKSQPFCFRSLDKKDF